MLVKNLIGLLYKENIYYEENVSLKTKTWLKRGGVAKLWIQPNSKDKLMIVTRFLYSSNLPFEVFGNTSNCYLTENYNPDITVSTLKVCDFVVEENLIICGCGYNLSKLAKYCIENGIFGYEGFIGIPGTVGGAAINNSGAYGSLISEVVRRIEILTPQCERVWLSNEQLNYKHRNSSLKSSLIKGVVLSVEFDSQNKENPMILQQKANQYIIHRKKYQENQYLNLGSIFSDIELFRNNRSIRALLYKIIYKITITIFRHKAQKINKYLVIFLYGKFSLFKHISDKSLNCFIWKDESVSESVFFKYISFIRSIAKKSILEITIK